MVDGTVDRTVACRWTGLRHDGGRACGRSDWWWTGLWTGLWHDGGQGGDRAETWRWGDGGRRWTVAGREWRLVEG